MDGSLRSVQSGAVIKENVLPLLLVATLLCAIAAVGIAMAWRADRQRLLRELEEQRKATNLFQASYQSLSDERRRYVTGMIDDVVMQTVTSAGGRADYRVTEISLPSADALTDRMAERLHSLKRCDQVTLEGPTFTDEIVNRIVDLPLESLFLVGTRVTDAVVAKIAILDLRELSLAGSQVTDEGLRHVGTMRRLRMLDISGTRITDSGLAHIQNLATLKCLVANSTEITDAGLAHIGHLSSLTELAICSTRITDGGLAHLKNLKCLDNFPLNDTQITGAGLRHLCGIETLRAMHIARTQISDADLDVLKEMRALKFVELNGTLVTPTAIARLQGCVPTLWIDHPHAKNSPTADSTSEPSP